MTITREQVADLQPGDVVELTSTRYPGYVVRGPLRESRDGLCIGPEWFAYRTDKAPSPSWEEDYTLTVVSRAPRPLYVNHPRTEPVPGDVVRDADDDSDRRTWMRRGNTTAPEWIRVVDGPEVRTCSTLIDAHDRRVHMPRRLRLLVDGETGQVVP